MISRPWPIPSHSIHDFLKGAVIIPEVHLHLFYAGFAFVVRVGLGVQQDGNHLVGEAVLGEAANAHVPLAEFGIELQQPLREAVEDQVGEADEVVPVVVDQLEGERVAVHFFCEGLRVGHNLVSRQDFLDRHQIFRRKGLLLAAQFVVGADQILHVAHQLVDAVLVALHLPPKVLHLQLMVADFLSHNQEDEQQGNDS